MQLPLPPTRPPYEACHLVWRCESSGTSNPFENISDSSVVTCVNFFCLPFPPQRAVILREPFITQFLIKTSFQFFKSDRKLLGNDSSSVADSSLKTKQH